MDKSDSFLVDDKLMLMAFLCNRAEYFKAYMYVPASLTVTHKRNPLFSHIVFICFFFFFGLYVFHVIIKINQFK